MGEIAQCLFIPRQSRSLHYHTYLGKVGSEVFIRWWIDRFRARCPGCPLIIAVPSGDDERSARDVLGSLDSLTSIMAVCRQGKLRRVIEVCEHHKLDSIGVVGFEFALAPEGLALHVSAHHQQSANSYTLVKGLPSTVCPQIFDVSPLRELAALRMPGLPTDPAGALERIKSISEQFEVASPLERLRHMPFEASQHYKFAPGELPERPILRSAKDLDRLQTVLSLVHGTADELAELKQWRKAVTRELGDLSQSSPLIHLISSGTEGISVDRPRILLVSQPSAFSGAEESLCQLAEAIDHNEFALYALVGTRGVFTDRLEGAGVSVLSSDHGFGSNATELAHYLLGVIQHVRPALVHFNALSDPVATSLLQLLGIPFVTHYRVPDIAAYRDQIRASAAVICVSRFSQKQVLSVDIDPGRVHVIYNGVDTRRFFPGCVSATELRRSLRLPHDALVMTMIARFTPNKRHDLMLEAFSRVKDELPLAHLILIGESYGEEGSTLDEVTDTISAKGLQERIHRIPFSRDIREIHQMSDLLVLCSDSEPLGRCIVESMAMARPVIVSDSGGSHEIVNHGDTGIVFKGGDAAALAGAILKLGGDAKLRSRIGCNARTFAVETLDSAISASQVSQIYNALITRIQNGLVAAP